MPAYEELQHKEIRNKDDYFEYVRAAYEEWRKGGRNDNPPQFFTGDIDADMAVISLNPHADPQTEGKTKRARREIDYRPYCETWDDTLYFFLHFCQERYEGRASKLIKGLSTFDRRVHQFLGGQRKPTHDDLAKWRIFHVEISSKATPNYKPEEGKQALCLSLLCALEAISVKDRSLILLLNNEGCGLIEKMNRWGWLKAEKVGKEQRYEIILNNGKLKVAKRLDYHITLRNGKSFHIVATPTFAQKFVMSIEFMQRYYDAAFTDEEKKILAAGLGITSCQGNGIEINSLTNITTKKEVTTMTRILDSTPDGDEKVVIGNTHGDAPSKEIRDFCGKEVVDELLEKMRGKPSGRVYFKKDGKSYRLYGGPNRATTIPGKYTFHVYIFK